MQQNWNLPLAECFCFNIGMRPVREIDSLNSLLRQKSQLQGAVIQGLNLRQVEVDWDELSCQGAFFLGCEFPDEIKACHLVEKGATVFPCFPGIPYHPYRPHLYTREELMEGWSEENDNSVDLRIYQHFAKYGRRNPQVLEALAMRLHDHAIDDALSDLLEGRVERDGTKKVVGIMGGHSMGRDEEDFKRVARVAWRLAREGYFVATGGGPGVMEAGNLGAYLSSETEEDLEWALELIEKAPGYKDEGYGTLAMQVIERFPHGASSLAVPTWFYGHEPTNWFAKHVAKYFSNSLREDGLLAMATHGVLYARGSAGTTQEVFMDACQNHYGTFDVISPMVFLDSDWFGSRTGIFETVTRQAEGKKYHQSIAMFDQVEDCVEFIIDNPPFKS